MLPRCATLLGGALHSDRVSRVYSMFTPLRIYFYSCLFYCALTFTHVYSIAHLHLLMFTLLRTYVYSYVLHCTFPVTHVYSVAHLRLLMFTLLCTYVYSCLLYCALAFTYVYSILHLRLLMFTLLRSLVRIGVIFFPHVAVTSTSVGPQLPARTHALRHVEADGSECRRNTRAARHDG